MDDPTRGSLRVIAGQIAVIVGVSHLGLAAYYGVAGSGTVAGDPRVVVWAIAGAVLVGGVGVAAMGWRQRPLYVLGLLVTGLLVAGQLLWPVLAGERFYPGVPPASSLGDPVGYAYATVVDASPVARILLATEVVLVGVLLVLLSYRRP